MKTNSPNWGLWGEKEEVEEKFHKNPVVIPENSRKF